MSRRTIEFTYMKDTDDGEDEEEVVVELPAIFVVCPNCEGEGHHMTESMRQHAYTAEEIDELGGRDFIEEMRSGVYDVTCDECHGVRVLLVVDEDQIPAELRDIYYKSKRDDAEYAAMCAAERRYGA